MFCCYTVQEETYCEDKGQRCTDCVEANCHFLVMKDNTTICLTIKIFNSSHYNNNSHLSDLNMTEQIKCDGANYKTNEDFRTQGFIGVIVLVIIIIVWSASLMIFHGVRYYKAYKDGRPF